MFINGQLAGTTTYSGAGYSSATATTIGQYLGPTSSWASGYNGLSVAGTEENIHGYIDDVRITSGVARYTSSFTPSAYAAPNQ